MKNKKKSINIIITCYNEEKSINILYKKLNSICLNLNYNFNYIFIDNNSTDKSEQLLKKLSSIDKRVKAIIMSRNFQSPQPSYIAGITNSSSDAVILLHGDMQDPVELIPKFIKNWENGYDIVYGIITNRKGITPLMNMFYVAFYYIYYLLSPIKIPRNSSDFSLIDKKVTKHILKFKEREFIFRGIRTYVGFNSIGIKYQRQPRIYGKSKENFFSNIWWAKTIIFTFSAKPLSFVFRIFVIYGFIILTWFIYLIIKYFYHGSISDLQITITIILSIGLIQLFSLSLISEYISRIFIEVKNRPRYIIKKKYNI